MFSHQESVTLEIGITQVKTIQRVVEIRYHNFQQFYFTTETWQMKSWKGAKAIYFVSNLSIVLTIWLFSNIIFHINQRKTLDSILDHFLWRTGISLAQLMQIRYKNLEYLNVNTRAADKLHNFTDTNTKKTTLSFLILSSYLQRSVFFIKKK